MTRRQYVLDHFASEGAHDPGWPFARNSKNYGTVVGCKRRQVLVHRFVWECVHGPIPDGLFVLHTCDTPPCFFIGHLFLGTHAENMADMVAKGRQAMKRTKSEPIQFRLPLADDAVLVRRAKEAGMSRKDYVIALTIADIEAHQTPEEAEARAS